MSSESAPSSSSALLQRYGGPAIVALTGLVMLIWSWGTWPDVITDFGRELYVPWQLSEGKVLYRDIVSYFNGPLSPYTHALLFKIFGVSLRTLVLFNLLVLAVLATLLYRLIAEAAGELAATAAGVTFFVLFAFAQYLLTGNYNYVCPYSYELPHGITLSVGMIACLAQWHQGSKRVWLIAAAALLGLVFLTKAEIFLAAAVTLGVAFVAEQWFKRRLAVIDVVSAAGAALVPILVTFLLMITHLTSSEALLGLAGSWRWIGERQLLDLPYFKELAGTANPRQTFQTIGIWTIAYVIVFGLPVAIGWIIQRRDIAAAAAIGIIWTILGFAFCDLIPWADFIRPMPLVGGCALIAIAWRVWRRSDKAFLPLVLLIWSLAMLAKMPLNAHIYHYGFALSMPVTLIGVALLIGWLPSWLEQWRPGSGGPLRAAVAAALIVSFYANVRWSVSFWNHKTVIVGNNADSFRADDRGTIVNAAMAELSRVARPGQTLVVVPEGLIINYLTRRENPTGQHQFTPPAVVMYGEQNMLDTLRAHPPDFVMLSAIDTSEYGARFFGDDYARQIGTWIQQHYSVVRVVGARPFRDPGFGIVLFRRND